MLSEYCTNDRPNIWPLYGDCSQVHSVSPHIAYLEYPLHIRQDIS